jgi:CheY-like chemotaxis protein
MHRLPVRKGMKQNGDLHKVLVIDDDDDLAEVVRQVLRDSGYSVATVRHGAAALELVRHISPDLILLDLTMPIMDGWSFVGQYRRSGTSSARIVLLTGNPHAPEIARNLGADGYLNKPFEIDDLIGVVTRELALN